MFGNKSFVLNLLFQYSSWDEQHIRDFIDVKVNCLDPNNRRIELDDIEAIKNLSAELQAENEQCQSAADNDASDNNDGTGDPEPGSDKDQDENEEDDS